MNNQERQALIERVSEIYTEYSKPNHPKAFSVKDTEIAKLALIALAALTAEPVPDGWEACSPEWIERNGPCSCANAPRLAFGSVGQHYHPHTFIDNTAQQYEALAGWKMVPVEPTAEMYDAGDKQLATKQVWDAMLAAAPKPEGQ